MDDDEHEIGCECWTCELDRRACAAEEAPHGSRARYRRAVEARAAEWEDDAAAWARRIAQERQATGDPKRWSEDMCLAVERQAARHARAARRARRILEALT
jgi:hypothetical protein